MKLHYMGLGLSVVASLAAIAAVGIYQKDRILKPLELDQGMEAVKVPFLLATDDDLKLQIELARELQREEQAGQDPVGPTEPSATAPPETRPPATTPSASATPATLPPETDPPATQPPVTEPPATVPPATQPPATEPPVTEPPVTEPPATRPPATDPSEATVPTQSGTDPVPGSTVTGKNGRPVTAGSAGELEPGPMVDESWFDDALFIGDSRTDGLRLYSRIGKADYFCSTGLTVYTALTKKCSDKNFPSQTLEELLSARTYGKVLIGLGINECGNNLRSYIMGYQKLIDLVREKQPDATIILQAIMTCSTKKERQNACFGPENLYERNEAIRALADGVRIFYIDVNPVFADGTGYLPAGFSGDGCHLYAKYYPLWVEWIRTAVYGIPLAGPSAPPPETLPPETPPPETQPPETYPPETLPPETTPPETASPETVPPETTSPETPPSDPPPAV